MLDQHLTDDYRWPRLYKVAIDDYVHYYQKTGSFASFSKRYNFTKEMDLYGAIVDNLLLDTRLQQWWNDCITGEDRARVVADAALQEGVCLTEREIAELVCIVAHSGTQREIYREADALGEQMFIERYKRQTGCDYVEVECPINIYAD